MDVITPDLIHRLIESYGLLALFAIVMLESMGVPMPGETALVSAALYGGATHRIGIFAIVAVAAAAAIVGDNIGYSIGRRIGLKLLIRHGRYIGLDEARLRVGQYLFARHGGKIVFFGRFVALLRAFAAVFAGANRMPWRHFLVMNGLGGVCWAALFGGGAYLFGDTVTTLAAPVGAALLVAAIVLVAAGLMFFRRHERTLEARARIARPGPLTDR